MHSHFGREIEHGYHNDSFGKTWFGRFIIALGIVALVGTIAGALVTLSLYAF